MSAGTFSRLISRAGLFRQQGRPMTTSQHDLARVARAVIDANCYMTLATADGAGRPWPSPVWYAHADYREFFWISSPATRHSRNLAERPEAGIVIFDSHPLPGTAQAVYLTVTAAEVTTGQLSRGVEVFSSRSQALGIRRWTADEVRGPAPLRLYRARVSELSVIDGTDQRMRTDLGAAGR
jgi:pyridoxine/pyridoxamine 5'-phosphate oxidase